MQKVIAAESIPKEGSKPLVFETDFAQSHFHQFLILLRRNFSAYWKMPSYNSVRFFAATGIGLIFGSIFWGLGKKPTNASDVFNVAGGAHKSSTPLVLKHLTLAGVYGADLGPLNIMTRAVLYALLLCRRAMEERPHQLCP